MNDSNRALSEVPALIEERRKYESWLAALDARRDSTPGHVFERVQSDYKNRLQQVAEKLTSHRGALDEERASIESRLSLLEAEEQMRRDERAELELRTQVGELSADEAADALRSLDDTLTGLTGEKTSMREKIDAVREMLGEEKPAAPAPVAPPKRVTGAIGSANASGKETAAPSVQASFDELAFLSSVVGAERNAADARRTPPRSAAQEKLAEAEAASAAGVPVSEASAPAPEVSAPAPQASAPAPMVEHDPTPEIDEDEGHQADSPMSGVRGSGTGVIRNQSASEALLAGLATRKDRPSGADAPLASNIPGNTPIVLRASGAIEQSKTLKCNECGAMNYATEWYCERCGAELAAL